MTKRKYRKIRFYSQKEISEGEHYYYHLNGAKNFKAIRIATSEHIATKGMTTLHEIAHFFGMPITPQYEENPWHSMRTELVAWRIAKSFAKPKLWKDSVAMNYLKRWADYFGIRRKIKWRKLKIIELNKQWGS